MTDNLWINIICDSNGRTPLLIAAYFDNVDLVILLINKQGNTMLAKWLDSPCGASNDSRHASSILSKNFLIDMTTYLAVNNLICILLSFYSYRVQRL